AAPGPVSASIARMFLRRADSLPDETRRLLLLAAVSDTGELGVVEAAAAPLGLDIASLASAESAGLVRIHDGVIEFRHPLARSAIYGEAPADERRAAHRALAQTLPDRDVDRRAWHLAAAALGPDDGVSAALEQAAIRARDRTAYTTAATAFERAARLATTDSRRGALLYASADAAWVAGFADRAVALLDEASALDVDGETGIGIEHLRGHVTMRRGDVMEGHSILREAAERAARDDPDRAVVMLADATNACFYAGRAD